MPLLTEPTAQSLPDHVCIGAIAESVTDYAWNRIPTPKNGINRLWAYAWPLPAGIQAQHEWMYMEWDNFRADPSPSPEKIFTIVTNTHNDLPLYRTDKYITARNVRRHIEAGRAEWINSPIPLLPYNPEAFIGLVSLRSAQQSLLEFFGLVSRVPGDPERWSWAPPVSLYHCSGDRSERETLADWDDQLRTWYSRVLLGRHELVRRQRATQRDVRPIKAVYDQAIDEVRASGRRISYQNVATEISRLLPENEPPVPATTLRDWVNNRALDELPRY